MMLRNRLLASSGSRYSYHGNSLRVQKVSGSATTVYLFSRTKVIAEYSGANSSYPLAREYIYSGSQLRLPA